MKREPFDNRIEELLRQQADHVTMTGERQEQVLGRILNRVGEPGQKEDFGMMRRFTGKKIAVMAAAMCMVGVFTAVAAGKIVSVSSSMRTDQPDYRTAAEVTKDGDRLGFTPKAVESFSNGYAFSQGYFSMMEGFDEEMNRVAEIPSVILDYRKGDHFLTLDMQSPGGLDSGEPDQVEVYEGIELEYSHLDSIFVSVDYTPTEEEQKLSEEGKLNIGYGLPEGSEKEETGFSFVRWEDGGGAYTLTSGEENGLSSSELLAMAKEIIDSGAAE